jgi:hypothetical protein
MNDVQKFNLKQARNWLSGEVEIRMPKAWLVGGGLALLVLLIIALD